MYAYIAEKTGKTEYYVLNLDGGLNQFKRIGPSEWVHFSQDSG